MTAAQKRALAKKLYLSGQSLAQIAEALDISVRTVHNYKSKDGDWENTKAQQSIEHGGEKLYANFIAYMEEFVKEIKESSMKPEIKAEKISQIGDAFAKMKRIAQYEDPKLFTHGIAKKTLASLLHHAKQEMHHTCLAALIEVIERHQEELADVTL